MPKKKKKKNKRTEPVLHIYCEGEKTEPIYINGYIDHYHSEHRNILVVEDTNKNTPVQLVETAIKAKKVILKMIFFGLFLIGNLLQSIHMHCT